MSLFVTTGPKKKCHEMQNGRIELATLADNLLACRYCAEPLYLSDCVGENRLGLGVTNDVATGPKHVRDLVGKAWDINSKLEM